MHKITYINESIDQIMKDFTCFLVTNDNHQNDAINRLKDHSDIIIIDNISNKEGEYLIICLKGTVIIISNSDFSLIQEFFDNHKDSTIFILSKSIAGLFSDQFHINFPKYSIPFKTYNFLKEEQLRKGWNPIIKCIFSYLVERCLKNDVKNDRIQNFECYSNLNEIKLSNENFFIAKHLTNGSSSLIDLIYNFEKKDIMILKSFSEDSKSKLFNREHNNYLNISHPFIPKYYGCATCNEKKNSLVIEYINGQSLEKIEEMKLTKEEKMRIIFQITTLIQYFHDKRYICRDLKPNNFIVKSDKTVVLIDFDRLLYKGEIDFNVTTQNFGHSFVAPEIYDEFSYEVDVYSLGMIIYFIFSEKVPVINDNLNFSAFTGDYSNLKRVVLQCVHNDPSKRPKISEIFDLLYTNFYSKIDKKINQTESNYFLYWLFIAQSKLVSLYEEEKNVIKTNIYLTKAKSLITQIVDNKDLQEIYSKFKVVFVDDENKVNDYISNCKMITFSISDLQKHKKGKAYHIYGNVVICAEGICIICNSAGVNNILKILQNTNASLINASEPNPIIEKIDKDDLVTEEIDNFCQFYNNDIKNNQLIRSTIRPICAFLIRRHFYPSNYFRDQSFFIFGQKTKDPINRVNLNNIFFSQRNLETLKDMFRKLYAPIFIKQVEILSNTGKPQFQTFQKNDFITLRKLQTTSKFTDELAIHIKSKYVLMVKRINDNQMKIDKEKFAKMASHDSFITFYGFLQEGEKVTGLIYDYLCNGQLTDYITNTPTLSNFYPLISLIRIYHGIDYINENCHNRPKIDLSNVFLDHDNIPFISYIFEPENEERNDSSINPSYINLIGEIIYLVFEKKAIPKRSKDIPSITNCPENIQKLYYSCISYKRGDRLTFGAIEDSIFDELEAIHFTESYLNKIPVAIKPIEIINFCYELIELLIYMKRIDRFASTILDFFMLPILLILKMTGDIPELNYQIGLLYENGLKGRHFYDKAKEYYELSVKENHWKALFHLGHLYENGNGVRKDYSIARKFYEFAAKKNNLYALLHLGMLYENGNGVKQNSAKAKEYFMLAVNQNNSEIPLQIGDIYYNGRGVMKDYSKAIEYYMISAKKNNPKALFKLGNIYENGIREHYINQDYTKAKEYYEQAGQLKNSEALVRIGDFYYYGKDSKPYLSGAKKYYELAAELKNPKAFFQLGLMYKDGYGVIKDDSKANKYFNEYIELQSGILLNLGRFYENGYGVEKNYTKAKEYYELALELNSSKALYHLGLLYKNGYGVHKDLAKSEEYFNKFAKIGYRDISLIYRDFQNPTQHYNVPQEYFYSYGSSNSEFLVNIGKFYEKGQGFHKNCLKAKMYYQLACEFKNSNAYYRLGRLHEKGYKEFIQQDYNKARDYYLISADLSNMKANYRLGNIFEKGLAGRQDYELSRKYFENSANPSSLKSYYRLGLIYMNGLGIEVNMNKAISNFTTCIKLYKNLDIQILQFKYNFYYYLSSNYLGLIYITSLPEVDLKNGENFLREGHYGMFPFSQNNLGLFFNLFTNKTGNAEYLFEEAGKQNFALALYNLGYMNEQNEKIDKAIYFYTQASKNEDEPLIFKHKKIEDEHLEISKTFIFCLMNLKLTKYYLSKYQYERSDSFFRSAFHRMKNFSVELDDRANNNMFSNLKTFIFNYPDFHLNLKENENQFNKSLSRKIILPSMSQSKKVEKREDIGKTNSRIKDEKMANKMSLKNSSLPVERKVFTDPKDLFAFAVRNNQCKDAFLNEIDQIVDEMNKILYKPPYRILFGRMGSKMSAKPQSLAKPLLPKRDISGSFYQGFAGDA